MYNLSHQQINNYKSKHLLGKYKFLIYKLQLINGISCNIWDPWSYYLCLSKHSKGQNLVIFCPNLVLKSQLYKIMDIFVDQKKINLNFLYRPIIWFSKLKQNKLGIIFYSNIQYSTIVHFVHSKLMMSKCVAQITNRRYYWIVKNIIRRKNNNSCSSLV